MSESPYEQRLKALDLVGSHLDTVKGIISNLVAGGSLAQYEVSELMKHVREAKNKSDDLFTDCRLQDNRWKASHYGTDKPS